MQHALSTAIISGNANDYKKARYSLQRAIKDAKREYRLRMTEFLYTKHVAGVTEYDRLSGQKQV